MSHNRIMRFLSGERMTDKRAYQRFDLEVPARLGIVGSGKVEEDGVSLRTTNICAGGAFLLTDDLLPEGTRVKMDFILSINKLKEMLDSHCRIRIEGEVIRKDASGIAVRFDEDYEIMSVKATIH